MASLLKCEICGGTLMGKPGGVFECESCGMQYSTEWARMKVEQMRGAVKTEEPAAAEAGVSVEALLKNGYLALEGRDWDSAKGYFERVLETDAENARAYVGLMCADMGYTKLSDMGSDMRSVRGNTPDGEVKYIPRVFENKYLKKAAYFADDELKRDLDLALNETQKRIGERTSRLNKYKAASRLAQTSIAAGRDHTVGLKFDGTVVAAGSYDDGGQCDLSSWSEISAVAAGWNHTVGLRSDGTAAAMGNNRNGKCDVAEWSDITAVAAGKDHTVGLKADGTVVATEYTGTFYGGQCDVSKWQGITAIAAGASHTVGLRADGTVVAVGDNSRGQCNVASWSDIAGIAAGAYHTVGFRTDGTAVAVGDNDHGQCNVAGWSDIVAVAAEYRHTVGLRSDGTVAAVGDNGYCQCDVAGWRDIAAIAAGASHTVGLRSGGTLVAAGNNEFGQCDVSGWKLFDSIDTLERERSESAEERRRIAEEKRLAEEEQRRLEEERRQKIEKLTSERDALKKELSELKGLFTGKRRKELEAGIEKLESELKVLEQ